MPPLSLNSDETRLIALAVVYHLGRPGSELDPTTLQRHELGLGPLQQTIENQISHTEMSLEISPYQLSRLGEALYGTINELKQYELSEGRSVLPGFAEAIARLFPEQVNAQGGALDLASQAVLLRRQLSQAIREAELEIQTERKKQTESIQTENPKPPWWQFWRR